MKIIVEDNVVDLDLPEKDVRLGQVIEEVEDFLFSVGKVPTSLAIDGCSLTQEELEDREEEVLSGQETLEFGVENVFEFVLQNLEGVAVANKGLVKDIQTFADEMQQQEKSVSVDQVLQELNDFFDFWMGLYRLIPKPFEGVSFGKKTIEEVLEGMRSLLTEIVGAMESSDFVLGSDLLRYEIVPLIEVVSEGIPTIKKRIEELEEQLRMAVP